MKVNYKIGNLELRLNDIPKEPHKIHSPWSEIVQWNECSGDRQEYCWTIATFEYNRDGYPELHYCGRRPLDLNKEESEVFLKLINEGYKYVRNTKGEIIKEGLLEEYYD